MPANLPPWLPNPAGTGSTPPAETLVEARVRDVFEQVFAQTPAAICVLRCRLETPYWVLEVQDNGLGGWPSRPTGRCLACFSATTPTSKARAWASTW